MSEVKSPLLPDRNKQNDLFVCDILDAAPKGDMGSMAHPVFSLSTKPSHRIRRYESGDQFLEIKPSSEGLATIHDRDILIYCISQLMAAINQGNEVAQTVKLKAYDFLKATNRVTDGRGYDSLRSALVRLQGTQIETNIISGGVEQLDIFSIIDRARIVRQTRDGRMQEVEIRLSDWVFNAINQKEVLTLHKDYFRLRKPLERRIYELARKHCGKKERWRVSLEILKDKCGSASTTREFKRLVKNIIKQDEEYSHMPDYAIRLDGHVIEFINRGTMFPETNAAWSGYLDDDSYEQAKTIAPGWDVYYLENEWRNWMTEAPKHPDKAFLGFCRKWIERRGAG